MQVETAAEQLFFITVYVAGKSADRQWTGTGFVYAVATDRGVVHVLVTNKHVLEGASELIVRLIESENKAPALGESTQTT
jgi:S1-C subfamily serine protease